MNANIDKLDLPYQDPELKAKLSQVAFGQKDKTTRNRAQVCSFFVRGECNRGKTCPYRHTDITEKDLESLKKGYGSVENKIRDRYHGINDPVATKIIAKIKEASKVPEAPEDMAITTLFVGGVTSDMSERDFTEQME